MKSQNHLNSFVFMALSLGVMFFFSSCDDEKADTTPKLSAPIVSEVTGTTVHVTAEILSDGGPEITAGGFVYSSSNEIPTLPDPFTEATLSEDGIEDDIDGLSSNTTYYIRAYAINGKGIGYGAITEFTTGNAAPEATNVSITGISEVNRQLTAIYTYTDENSDPEGASTFQWYAANDATGTAEAAISGATASTFTVREDQQGKYIRVGVTPKATSGVLVGTEVKSGFIGAIGEATTVTFTYNNLPVTYGILISAKTGKKWLDRNLGAPNAPTAYNDFANYGDLFQWGRKADGHQRINRTGPTDAEMMPVNGTTSPTDPYETSSTPEVGHNLFIIKGGGSGPLDWLIPQNDDLWQGINGINNPCPTGWRIPTATEWADETLGTLTEAYSKLNITLTSIRAGDSGNIFQSTTTARYWSSTIDFTSDIKGVIRITVSASGASQSTIPRVNGYVCRCIKN